MSTSPPIEESAPAPMTRRRFDTESPWVVNASRLILLIVLFALWEIGGGWLFDTFYFSKPSLIAKAFAKDIIDPAFYTDLATTGLELVLGYVIGGVSGIALGILLARWRFVGKICDPFLLALNSVPRIAVAPMLIVWFGIGYSSKVFLGATLVFFITFFNTLAGIRSVDKALCDIARVMQATEWQIFLKVMLPSASSWILTSIKISLPFALVGVILGEFLVSSQGLGFRLNTYSTNYNITGAMAIVFLMMVLMLLLTAITNAIEARALRWRPKSAAEPVAQS